MKKTANRIIALSVLALACSACDSGHDSKSEKNLTAALTAHKSDQVMSIDLNTILPKGWTKVCVQTPYMMQDALETAAGTKFKSYKMIADESSSILWVLHGKDEPTYLTIPADKVMTFRSPNTIFSSCTDPTLPEINLTYIKETKYFYFN